MEQGSIGETDTFGTAQHGPLLEVELPDPKVPQQNGAQAANTVGEYVNGMVNGVKEYVNGVTGGNQVDEVGKKANGDVNGH